MNKQTDRDLRKYLSLTKKLLEKTNYIEDTEEWRDLQEALRLYVGLYSYMEGVDPNHRGKLPQIIINFKEYE